MPAVKGMLSKAQSILGYDLLDLCLNGPKEKLDDTAYAQPALFVAGLAAVEKLRVESPDIVRDCSACAGLSLGEYCALAFAGVISFEEGLKVRLHFFGWAVATASCSAVLRFCHCCFSLSLTSRSRAHHHKGIAGVKVITELAAALQSCSVPRILSTLTGVASRENYLSCQESCVFGSMRTELEQQCSSSRQSK